jgi:hypothetical protein
MFLKFLLLYSVVSGKIIKNIDYPSCRNCVYYKPYKNGEFDSRLSNCEYFGTKNIHSDVISYDYADSCRIDETKCGLEGKYFVKDNNLSYKILLHTIYRNLPMSFFVLFFIIEIYYLNKIPKM